MMDVISIRKNILFNNALSVLKGNIRLSHFIPSIENGYMAERAFVISSLPKAPHRPFAYLGVLSETGDILFYKHCAVEDFMETKSYPLDTKVDDQLPADRTVEEQIHMERQLLETYEVVRQFAFRDELTSQQKVALRRFSELFNRVVPSGLMPYYHGLSSDFFRWAQKHLE